MKQARTKAPEPALTPEEAARRLGLHVVTVRKHLVAGLIPAARIGGAWRISPATIDAMLAGELQTPSPK